MYSSSTTPKRALLEVRWQYGISAGDRQPVVEIEEGNYALAHEKDLQNSLEKAKTGLNQSLDIPPFDHEYTRNIDPNKIVTFSGYLACHALWPFDPEYNANIIIGVEEYNEGRREDYRIANIKASRLVVAYSDTRFINPADKQFLDVITRPTDEIPHFDVFLTNYL